MYSKNDNDMDNENNHIVLVKTTFSMYFTVYKSRKVYFI
jgi:hypothetical protein